MRAAVLYQPQRPLTVEEVELAEPREGEALVRIVASGVCHSDLHVIDGTLPHPLPVVLGHEGAGVVERVGPGVTYARPGEHVILSFVPVCGRCYHCAIGRPNLCTGVRTTPGVMADGTRRLRRGDEEINHFSMVSSFAQYAVVPEGALVKVRPDAPLEKVCLIGCGVMTGVGAAINTARVRPGSTCVVVGCGGVGLSVIQGCLLAGAARIIAVDLVASKLALAEALGATHLIDASREDVLARVRQISGGGADYAFEAIGRPETMELAYECLGRGGLAVVVGLAPRGSRITLSATSFLNEKGIIGSVYGSARQRADMPMLVDLYLAGRLKLDELITRSYALEEINQAFDDLRSGRLARGVVVFP